VDTRVLHVILLDGFRELMPVTHWRELCRKGWHAASNRLVGFHISIMKPRASKNKRQPNDGYEPLTFRQNDVKKVPVLVQQRHHRACLNRLDDPGHYPFRSFPDAITARLFERLIAERASVEDWRSLF
jgi:hypothetical protein